MNQEETLVWKGTPSQWTNFGAYLFCLLLAAAVVAAYVIVTPRQPLILIGLAIPAVWMLSRWLGTKSHTYEITTERIRVSTGLLSRVTTELELYRVRDYTITEPFWLRLVGRGDIILQTADRTNPVLVIHAVPGVNTLKDQIRTHTERMRQLRGVRDLEIDPQSPQP
jgi:uncharacterized membrane protein YdbT with pleckstrin-like domain